MVIKRRSKLENLGNFSTFTVVSSTLIKANLGEGKTLVILYNKYISHHEERQKKGIKPG